MPAGSHWTIVGCGYVGTRLARTLLEQGCSVMATCRDLDSCASLRNKLPALKVQSFEIGDDLVVAEKSVVVVAAPPTASAPTGEQRLAALVPDDCRIVYISTTGVYGAAAGGAVDEDYEEAPISERGQRRLEVERAIAAIHEDTRLLRCPSIYGPGRGVHVRLQKGEYRLIGEAQCLVSRIHVDDLVAAIVCLGTTEDLEHHIFNVADDEASSARDHAMGIAAMFELEPPPTVDPESVSAAARAMLGGDRRILSPRLRDLGWRPVFPTWREGVRQALGKRLQ